MDEEVDASSGAGFQMRHSAASPEFGRAGIAVQDYIDGLTVVGFRDRDAWRGDQDDEEEQENEDQNDEDDYPQQVARAFGISCRRR